MASMSSARPARKVLVGAVVGAATTILLWLVETIGKTTIPSAVAVAISTLLTFIVSYLVPPSADDQVVS
jgi:putative flippase GtrA